MNASTTAPAPTRVALVATLAVVAAALVEYVVRRAGDEIEATHAAPFLWLFTALFAARVAGQLLVVAREPRWLPPMREWNLTPYRLLLPSQLLILALMIWIDVSFTVAAGAPAEPRPLLGEVVLVFSYVYAGAMVVRYCALMSLRPAARWFGGTIPIVFHVVLAAYLYVFGSFHASY